MPRNNYMSQYESPLYFESGQAMRKHNNIPGKSRAVTLTNVTTQKI